MENCANHKKEVAGITDMTALAEIVGDLHYQTLAEFLERLCLKLYKDALNDRSMGKTLLPDRLAEASTNIGQASSQIFEAWRICKPYMVPKEKKKVDHWTCGHPHAIYRSDQRYCPDCGLTTYGDFRD